MSTNEQTDFRDLLERFSNARADEQRFPCSDAKAKKLDVATHEIIAFVAQLSARASLATEMVELIEQAKKEMHESDFWERFDELGHVAARYRQATASGKELTASQANGDASQNEQFAAEGPDPQEEGAK